MVEINAETDFVARNEAFQGFVETVAKIALTTGEDVEALKAASYPDTGRNVADELGVTPLAVERTRVEKRCPASDRGRSRV